MNSESQTINNLCIHRHKNVLSHEIHSHKWSIGICVKLSDFTSKKIQLVEYGILCRCPQLEKCHDGREWQTVRNSQNLRVDRRHGDGACKILVNFLNKQMFWCSSMANSEQFPVSTSKQDLAYVSISLRP